QQQRLLVVNSWFCPQKPWLLYLSQSRDAGDTTTVWVPNAVISLYENGNYLGKFVHESKGRYRSPVLAQNGKTYRIEVEAEGFDPVSALDSMPAKVHIDSAFYDYSTEVASLSFTDPVNETNYYEVGPPFTTSPDPVVLAEGYTTINPYGNFFSDKLINGQSYTYTARQDEHFLYMPPYEYYRPCERQPCFFHLRALSQSLYLFHKSWIQHGFNITAGSIYDIPYLSEPLNVYNNVQGGLGIFAAYQEDSLQIVLRR
ncbi:MAG: DUF4249 domain-containing protein, partial [Bacteroidetes bacterium]